ncbi:Oidioi.mRNA.OKI2018_I69.chr1.g970.t1.cds [Oikopleura dioica]|uniref:Oidioi.mRNA.OKI2018_I69.chr1.g970.t1.cds n=1 Tax=Oikopleura dioica TaxID=34765 RepID=A0ABN7SLI8_OIKDI|nr:Oidioi.mRNA.OKI2018_I69.chr1.g970.t1.cds [Oikopleura dioica]
MIPLENDFYGYPENDPRRGWSILTWWTIDPSSCFALSFAVSLPWLSMTLAIASICIFIWEIDYRGARVLWYSLAFITSILFFLDSNFIITALYNDSYEWQTVLTLLEAGRITAWIVLVSGTISFIQCLIGLCCWPDQKVSPSEIELQVDPAIANLPLEYQQEAIEHRKRELEKEMVQ